MKKLALVGLLFPVYVFAKVNWINSSVSELAVTRQYVDLNVSESMMLNLKGDKIKVYNVYCSESQQDAESNSESGNMERSNIGPYNWTEYSVDVPAQATITSSYLGRIGAEGVNRQTYTMYCLLHPSGIAASDARVTATGLIVSADLATVPKPVISIPSPDVNLGSCPKGKTLQAKIPVGISFLGYGSTQTSSLSWTINKDSNNPDNSQPVVTIKGSVTSPVNIPLQNNPVDYPVTLDYTCQTPGSYKWSAELTYTIQ